MNKAVESILVVVAALGFYAGLPALMIWGWARWFRRTQPRTLPPILSLIGFTFATASGLLGVSSVLYAHARGGFPYYDPLLMRIYGWGGMLSLSGIVFGVGGCGDRVRCAGLLLSVPWGLSCSGSRRRWGNSLSFSRRSGGFPWPIASPNRCPIPTCLAALSGPDPAADPDRECGDSGTVRGGFSCSRSAVAG